MPRALLLAALTSPLPALSHLSPSSPPLTYSFVTSPLPAHPSLCITFVPSVFPARSSPHPSPPPPPFSLPRSPRPSSPSINCPHSSSDRTLYSLSCSPYSSPHTHTHGGICPHLIFTFPLHCPVASLPALSSHLHPPSTPSPLESSTLCIFPSADLKGSVATS